MEQIIIGIDPGQTGAIAAINDGKVIALHDMPTMPRLHGKGQQVDGYALSMMILEVHGPKMVLVEAVHAMPGQGVASSFRFGESVGVVLGVIGALGLPVKMITPQMWKKRFGLIKKPKDASRTIAIQQHPEIADMLTRKKDHGRADAILIGKMGL